MLNLTKIWIRKGNHFNKICAVGDSGLQVVIQEVNYNFGDHICWRHGWQAADIESDRNANYSDVAIYFNKFSLASALKDADNKFAIKA
jgi:hypothetical protein